MLLVVRKLSRDVIGNENWECHRCLSIRLLSEFLNSRLLLFKLSVVIQIVSRFLAVSFV